jgi:hypothetical protein
MPGQYRLCLFYGEVFSHVAAGFSDNVFVLDPFALAKADATKQLHRPVCIDMLQKLSVAAAFIGLEELQGDLAVIVKPRLGACAILGLRQQYCQLSYWQRAMQLPKAGALKNQAVVDVPQIGTEKL